jgi:DNA-binding response OmpR family regulator
MRATRTGVPLLPSSAGNELRGHGQAAQPAFHGLGPSDPGPDYDDGRLVIRARDYVAAIDGHTIAIPVGELALLAELARHAGRVRTREQLLEAVWGGPSAATVRTVDTAIARLRATLQQRIPELAYVHTHVKVGYRFEREPAAH